MHDSTAIACEWDSLSTGSACLRCGYVLKHDYEKVPYRECQGQPTGAVLLGDRIEAALMAAGVTKARWGAFTSSFGHPPTPGCSGCDKRQQLINDADQYMRDVVANLGEKAAGALSKAWGALNSIIE